MENIKTIEKRFWANIEKSDGCWVWKGYVANNGRGMLQARKVSRFPLYAHRVAWELANGPIPNNLHVLHTCDNPICCNPEHLWLGTQADNNRDRDFKKRAARGDNNGARTMPERNSFVKNGGSGLKGEKHPMAKLTLKQVKEIRNKYYKNPAFGMKAKLAKEYGVSQVQIGRIINNKLYKK